MKTGKPNFFIEDYFYLLKSDGSEVKVIYRIGKPFFESDCWYCACELDGVDGRYPDRQGINAIQALTLAIKLIESRLLHLLEDGNNLYLPDETEISINSVILKSIFN